MLMLTRTAGQAIMIGDNIQIAVLEVKGGQVRLGIKAPQDIPVHRQEIYEDIQAKKTGEAQKDKEGTEN